MRCRNLGHGLLARQSVYLGCEGRSKVGMSSFKVVGEPLVGRVVLQSGLEEFGRCASFRGEPADRYAIASDDDGLTVLDLVKELRKVACRLRGRYGHHGYIPSDPAGLGA
jgi:hypothetical protein